MKNHAQLDRLCPEALALLEIYLHALEANYRAHLPYIEALQTAQAESVDAFMSTIDSAREQLRQSRRNLIEHQESHGCAMIRAENFQENFAA